MSKSGKAAARRQFPYEVHNGLRGVRRPDGTFEPTAKVAKLKPPEWPYAQINLKEAAEAFAAIGTPGAMLWPLLVYLHYKHGGRPFPLSNAETARHGISRTNKGRHLARLKKAGKISLRQKGRESVEVTLLKR